MKKLDYLEKTSQVYKGWLPGNALPVHDLHVFMNVCMYLCMCVYITFFVGIAIKTKHVLVHVKGIAKCHRGMYMCYSSMRYIHVDCN